MWLLRLTLWRRALWSNRQTKGFNAGQVETESVILMYPSHLGPKRSQCASWHLLMMVYFRFHLSAALTIFQFNNITSIERSCLNGHQDLVYSNFSRCSGLDIPSFVFLDRSAITSSCQYTKPAQVAPEPTRNWPATTPKKAFIVVRVTI